MTKIHRALRRVLISVSDKTGLVELARELASREVEILASGGTLRTLQDAGIAARSVESFSGNPEAFQGRMKTLSFKIFSGILARREDASDQKDRDRLDIPEIDAVIVNFYPFEKAAADASREEKIELIDIGGPALVRAAAKNAPDVLVVTDPAFYPDVIRELREGGVSDRLSRRCAARAWERVAEYDLSIRGEFGDRIRIPLRYGENPHQEAYFEMRKDSPLRFDSAIGGLSYNNILDVSAAYRLMNELKAANPRSAVVVIVKHNNPCGVAIVEGGTDPLKDALELAWAGDPVSAFGGVLAFSDPITTSVADWLEGKFVECVVAPEATPESEGIQALRRRRKNLKAVPCAESPAGAEARFQTHDVIGGTLFQKADRDQAEIWEVRSGDEWSAERRALGRFGVVVAKNLKSNAIAVVGRHEKGLTLLGAGQGQPNRIDALETLAIPRARETAERLGLDLGRDSVLVSDAFFPFADSIEACAREGIRYILEPGGSIKDGEVVAEAQKRNMSLVFTGVRHFLH